MEPPLPSERQEAEPVAHQASRYPKIVEAALDELPTDQSWDEDQLTEWLDWFEGALRVHFKLPREKLRPDSRFQNASSRPQQSSGE